MPAFTCRTVSFSNWRHGLRSLNQSAFDTKWRAMSQAASGLFSAKANARLHMCKAVGKANGPGLCPPSPPLDRARLELVLDNPTSQMASTPPAELSRVGPSVRLTAWRVVNVKMRDGKRLALFCARPGRA
jgi:hypothetical protein